MRRAARHHPPLPHSPACSQRELADRRVGEAKADALLARSEASAAAAAATAAERRLERQADAHAADSRAAAEPHIRLLRQLKAEKLVLEQRLARVGHSPHPEPARASPPSAVGCHPTGERLEPPGAVELREAAEAAEAAEARVAALDALLAGEVAARRRAVAAASSAEARLAMADSIAESEAARADTAEARATAAAEAAVQLERYCTSVLQRLGIAGHDVDVPRRAEGGELGLAVAGTRECRIVDAMPSAVAAGVEVGDVVAAVMGEPVLGCGEERVRAAIAAAEGPSVAMRVLRVPEADDDASTDAETDGDSAVTWCGRRLAVALAAATACPGLSVQISPVLVPATHPLHTSAVKHAGEVGEIVQVDRTDGTVQVETDNTVTWVPAEACLLLVAASDLAAWTGTEDRD